MTFEIIFCIFFSIQNNVSTHTRLISRPRIDLNHGFSCLLLPYNRSVTFQVRSGLNEIQVLFSIGVYHMSGDSIPQYKFQQLIRALTIPLPDHAI